MVCPDHKEYYSSCVTCRRRRRMIGEKAMGVLQAIVKTIGNATDTEDVGRVYLDKESIYYLQEFLKFGMQAAYAPKFDSDKLGVVLNGVDNLFDSRMSAEIYLRNALKDFRESME